jgi:hypothetical protein
VKARGWSGRVVELASGSPALTCDMEIPMEGGRWTVEDGKVGTWKGVLARACQDSEEGVGEVFQDVALPKANVECRGGSTSDWSKLPARIFSSSFELQGPA